MALILGTANDDFLIGTPESDTVLGLDGDDRIIPGTGGSDTVDGGDGFDTLDLSFYDSSFIDVSGSSGTASFEGGDFFGSVDFSNIENIVGTDGESTVFAGDVVFLDSASHGYTIDVGAGFDFVLLSPFPDTITLGMDQGDLVRGNLTSFDGDVFTDWDNSDSMGFVGFTFDASNVIQTSSTTQTTLEIDGDQDGITDATVTLLGDYTDGAFEYLNSGGSTFIYWNSNTGETLVGGSGTNIFRGSLGDDTYFGLGGNDSLLGDAGDDTLYGGDGNDSLFGESGSDTLTGGAGMDRFFSSSPGDFDGDVITDLELGESLVFQFATFDESAINLEPNAAGATLSGDVDGDGTDDFNLTLLGDFSDLGFIATPTFDGGTALTLVNVLRGGQGSGAITGTDDAEIIDTGGGKGTADGAGGDDLIRGGGGSQSLFGGDGNDRLFGNQGNDVLNGGNGSDILVGGAGRDTLTGGEGSDVFVLTEHGGQDTVTDFEDGIDIIDLSVFGFSDISELTITQDGADVNLQILGGVSLTLENFDATNLDNSDFNFGP